MREKQQRGGEREAEETNLNRNPERGGRENLSGSTGKK